MTTLIAICCRATATAVTLHVDHGRRLARGALVTFTFPNGELHGPHAVWPHDSEHGVDAVWFELSAPDLPPWPSECRLEEYRR